MSLILENISGALLEINDLGFALVNGSSVDLESESEASTVTASAYGGDLETVITGGAVVIKDPLNGTVNLSTAEALAACRAHNETHYRMPVGGRVIDIPDVVAPTLAPGEFLEWNGSAWVNVTSTAGTDEVVKVSSNDTTAGYLSTKLIAGTSINLVENNDGGNETLSIVNTAPNIDQNLWETIISDSGNVSASTTTDSLSVIGGAGIATSIVGSTITIASTTGVASDELVKITVSDTTGGYLDSELVVGTGLAKSVLNSGANETLELSLNAGFNDLNDVTLTPTGAPLDIPDNSIVQYNATLGVWENRTVVPAPPPGGSLVIQLKWGPISSLSGTAAIPKDTTAPLITEGAEIWSANITPQESSSTIRVATNVTFSSSNASIELVFAVFRGSTCVGTAVNTTANKSSGFAISFEVYDVPATTSQLTYSVRVGRTGPNGTWYINDIHSTIGAFAGSLAQNSYSVEEIGTIT